MSRVKYLNTDDFTHPQNIIDNLDLNNVSEMCIMIQDKEGLMSYYSCTSHTEKLLFLAACFQKYLLDEAMAELT